MGGPGGSLAPFVLAVPDLDGVARQRLARVIGVEDELDHLPVALVRVVPVVERVVEPVLERELARVIGVVRNVRIGGRLLPLRQAPRPLLVAASRVERTPGEVEVVLVEAREVLRNGGDLDEVDRIPRSPECDRLLTEQPLDVNGLVRLPVAALPCLLDQPYDGRG